MQRMKHQPLPPQVKTQQIAQMWHALQQSKTSWTPAADAMQTVKAQGKRVRGGKGPLQMARAPTVTPAEHDKIPTEMFGEGKPMKSITTMDTQLTVPNEAGIASDLLKTLSQAYNETGHGNRAKRLTKARQDAIAEIMFQARQNNAWAGGALHTLRALYGDVKPARKRAKKA